MSSGRDVLFRRRHPGSGPLLQASSLHRFSPKEAKSRKAADTLNKSNVPAEKKMMSEATASGDDV